MDKPNNGILADTGVWIDFFRGGEGAGAHLGALIASTPVWVCGVVIYELLQGVRFPGEKDKIRNALAGLPYVEMSPSVWERAAGISADLKKGGLTLPLSDIIIAASALEHDLSIFTLDKHFEQVPGVKLLT